MALRTPSHWPDLRHMTLFTSSRLGTIVAQCQELVQSAKEGSVSRHPQHTPLCGKTQHPLNTDTEKASSRHLLNEQLKRRVAQTLRGMLATLKTDAEADGETAPFVCFH